MISSILIDTGVITSFYASIQRDPRIISLMERIKSGNLRAVLLKATLIECLSQLCKQPGGIAYAETTMASFLKNYNVFVEDIDSNIAFKAGRLKCQYRKKLSNVDCMAIAYALNNNITFHTTEKDLHKLLPKLKLETYSF